MSSHVVQFYEHETALVETVGEFLAAGLKSRQPAVVIATDSHARSFTDALATRGVPVDEAIRGGRLTILPADRTLASIMGESHPDEDRFKSTIAAMVEQQLAGANGTGVRLYGEMVDLLWKQGKREAAIRLEELWQDLTARHPISLLCAYAMANFYHETGDLLLHDICKHHTHVVARTDGGPAEIRPLRPTPGPQALRAELDHRKQLEEALRQALAERRRAEQALRTQYALASVLAEAKSLRDATPRILQAVCDSGGWKLGAIWKADAAAGLIRCMDVWHADPQTAEFAEVTRGAALPAGVGLPGRVWASARPLWIPDVVKDAHFTRAPHAARAGLHGAFAFPMRLDGRVTGMIECFSREVRQPEEPLLQLFDAIGNQIGQFIDRREADEARERLAAIVECSDDAIVSKTLDGVIMSWNPGAERIFGYTAAEAIGRHITLIIPEERHGEEADVLARLRRGEKIDHFETERRTKDGRIVSISLTVSPIRTPDGRIVGASKVARDITIQKRAAQALAASERHLQQAVRWRDDFLSMAAHELRNPLNALQLQLVGLLRAAQERAGNVPSDWVCERVGHAVDDLERLVSLVHHLLDVSRLTAGRLELEPEDVELGAIVTAAIARLQDKILDGQVRVRLEYVEGRWDRLRLDQVVTNLVSNAIKYGNGKPIDVTLSADADYASVVVVDRGIGIEPDAQQKLFERFARAVPRRRYSGFGLGLWITRKIVDAMGGEISLASTPGEGSTFRVKLPRRPPSLHRGEVAIAQVHPIEHAAGEPLEL